MTGFPDNTPFCRTSLKYPEASDRVVALVTPSDAVITTSAIGTSFLVSASRWITAPSIGIDRRTLIDRNRCARNNSAMTTAAATAMIVQTTFFAVIAAPINSWTRNPEYMLPVDALIGSIRASIIQYIVLPEVSVAWTNADGLNEHG